VDAAGRALAAVGSQDSLLSRRIRARVALLSGKPADAEALFRQLLDQYPNSSGARLDLASAQAAQGHNADAVATLKTLVESDPNDPQAWLLLGRNAVLMGRKRKAVQDYLSRALASRASSKRRRESRCLGGDGRRLPALERLSPGARELYRHLKIQSTLGRRALRRPSEPHAGLPVHEEGWESEADLQWRGIYEKLMWLRSTPERGRSAEDRAGLRARSRAIGTPETARESAASACC
jgi:tetratricopeptide (TPR) repeat protein